MTGLELHNRLEGLRVELERESRFVLAYLLAREAVGRRVFSGEDFDRAADELRVELARVRPIARMVACNRRFERILAGEAPKPRRSRKRTRRRTP